MFSGCRKTIGVFINNSDRYFTEIVYRRIEREAERLNLDVIAFYTVGSHRSNNLYDTREKGIFNFVSPERLDGILVAPDTYETRGFRDELMTMLTERTTCPIVAIRTHAAPWDSVFIDDNQAIRPLLRHLMEDHGLKKICFMAGYPGHPDSEARLVCYREEMASHGLELPENAVFNGTMWDVDGEAAYEHYFASGAEKPEAIVCANDFMARGLIRALGEHQIRVPEDVIVTGFDHVDNLGSNLISLTTVDQDYDAIALQGLELLEERMRERELGIADPERKMIGLPGSLIMGKSCGCAVADPQEIRRESSRNARMLFRMKEWQETMTYASMELSACETLEELHSAILEKEKDIRTQRDFCLCLFEKDDENAGKHRFAREITDRVCVVSVMRDGTDQGIPMISFDRRELIPPQLRGGEEARVYFLNLLHQQESTYGYTLTSYYPDNVPTGFFSQWNIMIASALRNMHSRRVLQKLYEERRISSITDVMTHLYNRRGLEEQLESIWGRLTHEQSHVAFVYFDMDHLKHINDTFGHAAGDIAIRMVSQAIRQVSPPEAIIARMGGDEFLSVLPGAGEKAARDYMRRFGEALKRINGAEKRSFLVECSCGAFVTTPDSELTLERCIQESDGIMYREKCLRHAREEKES